MADFFNGASMRMGLRAPPDLKVNLRGVTSRSLNDVMGGLEGLIGADLTSPGTGSSNGPLPSGYQYDQAAQRLVATRGGTTVDVGQVRSEALSNVTGAVRDFIQSYPTLQEATTPMPTDARLYSYVDGAGGDVYTPGTMRMSGTGATFKDFDFKGITTGMLDSVLGTFNRVDGFRLAPAPAPTGELANQAATLLGANSDPSAHGSFGEYFDGRFMRVNVNLNGDSLDLKGVTRNELSGVLGSVEKFVVQQGKLDRKAPRNDPAAVDYSYTPDTKRMIVEAGGSTVDIKGVAPEIAADVGGAARAYLQGDALPATLTNQAPQSSFVEDNNALYEGGAMRVVLENKAADFNLEVKGITPDMLVDTLDTARSMQGGVAEDTANVPDPGATPTTTGDPGATPTTTGTSLDLPDPTDNQFLDELDALLNASVLQSVSVLGKQIEMGIVTAGVTALSGLAGAFRDIVTTVGRNIRA